MFPRRSAKAIKGVSLVMGRGRSAIYDRDWVYTVLQLASEPRTYKPVIGWRDERPRRGGGNELRRCAGHGARQ
jgi:hypothetical protein